MRHELNDVAAIVNVFRPITLEEMNGVRLMNRTDTKYVITLGQLAELLRYAQNHYRVQETLGERLIEYKTTYYDTADWRMLRAHTTGRCTRQKVRIRTYVSSLLSFVEIKRKNNHGRTRKRRIVTQRTPDDRLSLEAQSFITTNSDYKGSSLQPAIGNTFRRITLVNDAMTERLTIDLDLELSNLRTGGDVTLGETVIVEVKRDGLTPSPIVEWMKTSGIRHHGFSKYCYGALLTDPSLPIGKMKPKMRQLMRRGLIPEPVSAWRRWAA